MKYTTPWLLSRCYYCLQVSVSVLVLVLVFLLWVSWSWTSFEETEVFGWERLRRLRLGAVAGHRHRNGFVSLLTLTPRWPAASFRDALREINGGVLKML